MGPAPIDPPMSNPPAAPLGAGSPPAPTSAPSPTPIRRSEEPPTSTHRPDKLRVRVSEGDGERVGIGRSRHPWQRPVACQSGPGGRFHQGRSRVNTTTTGWDVVMQIGLTHEGMSADGQSTPLSHERARARDVANVRPLGRSFVALAPRVFALDASSACNAQSACMGSERSQ